MTDERPDPESMLARLRTEEPQAAAVSSSPQRGTLRVFLGYAAGVGKTYSMLGSARAASAAGRDVVIGYVEPHGRPETEALIDGLEQLPLRALEYRGTTLRELDLEGALARRPEVLLVDELAHTNAPGSLHTKRWQDIEDLLKAGINVWTTVNIQHVESLNDIVAKVTGVLVRETVPDRVIDQATEIELVDIPPEELLERLAEGKVYVPEQARRAIDRFFAKTNLLALRELSMRQVADRVGEQVDTARLGRGRDTVWPTRERLLACVGPSPTSAKVIRTAKRLATAMHAEWTAVHLETPGERRLDGRARHRLVKHLQLAERLGAETVTLTGEDVAAELVHYAHSRSATKIVIGKTREKRRRLWRTPSIVERLIELSGDTDVYVIQGVEERAQGRPPPEGPQPRDPTAYLKAAAALVPATGVAWLFHLLGFPDATLVMAYLLSVVVVASGLGRGPAVATSALSVLLYNFLFTRPYYTFTVDDPGHIEVFVVMFLVAVAVSGVMARVRDRLKLARQQERRLAMLYRVSQHLAVTTGTLPLVNVAESLLAELLPGVATIHLPRPDGLAPVLRRDAPEEAAELAAARWVFEHGEPAGQGTDTLPAARALYLPLVGAAGPVGVLAWRARTEEELLAPGARHLLETFATQAALALERDQLARDAQRVLAEAEAERLRSSLLSALSHDLRTPLAAITGSASGLLQPEEPDASTRRELAETIHTESDRLGRLVENLLHMTRIHAGRLEIDKQWHPLEEVIGSALSRLERAIGDREILLDVPPQPVLVPMDGLLIEQVLVNLLDNALKYCPPDSPIEVGARAADEEAEVWVADRGPGIPPTSASTCSRSSSGAPPARDGRGGGAPAWGWRSATPSCWRTRVASALRRVRAAARASSSRSRAARRPRPWGRRTHPSEAAGGRCPVTPPLVLIVEDEQAIRRFVKAALKGEGYRLAEAETGRLALSMARAEPPDVIVLDLGLPDLDGLEVIVGIRAWSQVPIIVLSARDREGQKVEALDRGADDYLTKPFGVEELLARIRVALRHGARLPPGSAAPGPSRFQAGDLAVDLDARRVVVRGEEVHLTPIEYRLLTTLLQHAGKVLTHRFLLKEVWGPGYSEEYHYLRVHMANLRRKVEAEPARPKLLITEQGVGYRLRVE